MKRKKVSRMSRSRRHEGNDPSGPSPLHGLAIAIALLVSGAVPASAGPADEEYTVGDAAAVSPTGNASCEGLHCVAASGTGTASCEGRYCLAATGTGTGTARCSTPDFVRVLFGACFAVAVTGDAHGVPYGFSATGNCQGEPCWAANTTGPADGWWLAVSATGDADGGLAVGPFGNASGVLAVSATDDATGWVAVTGTGDAQCGWPCLIVVSGTGQADDESAYHPVSGCETGRLFGVEAACQEEPDALP